MKTTFVILFLLISIGITFSFAPQTADGSDTAQSEILLQLILRNSDGNLVSYVETDEILKINSLELNKFLDKQTQKKIIVRDGEKYDVIQWVGEMESIQKKITYSLFYLSTPDQDRFPKELVVLGHNSFQIQPGDTLTSYWTVIRLAN